MLTAFILLSALGRPAACVNDLDTPRPALTLAEQTRTRRLIERSVASLGGSPTFAAFLVLVATRESSLQQGLVHRLAQDVGGSRSAFLSTRKLYQGSPFAGAAERWQTMGLFGMNASYFTVLWDRMADPMVLCDAVVDVMVYQRAAGRALAKMLRTGACAPTWATVHAAVSSGVFCPEPERMADFRRRARKAGINPDAPVTAAALGRSPAPDEQDAVAARLRLAAW